ncbi:MAG: TIM-barrel domain-containing protein, partial [Bacteroidota bacterium]
GVAFETPKLRIGFASSALDGLEEYADHLDTIGLVPKNESKTQSWWKEPIVCGWGQQCYMGDLFRVRSPRTRPKDNAVYQMCTQRTYDDIVDRLDEAGINWTTLVIDARWTISSGTKDVDVGRWPDLPGFIARMHERDKKVLLWWGPWDFEGLPDDYCIELVKGYESHPGNRPGRFAKFGASPGPRAICPDPCNPYFQELIRQRIRFFLSDEEGCCNADGLKVDHVSACPGSYGLNYNSITADRKYGIDLLHMHLRHLYACAKEFDESCLIIGQSPNPYFADCQDLVRLGDIYSGEPSVVREMIRRASVAQVSRSAFGLDTDGWPMPSIAAMEEYSQYQAQLGTPSIYYSEALDTTAERVTNEVLRRVQSNWRKAENHVLPYNE